MGQDAVALIRCRALRAPSGSSLTVIQLRDCALVLTSDRYAGCSADEHAVRLHDELGPRLDAHDDPRGILFFSDICEPVGQTYNAIVREIGSAGKWGSVSRFERKHEPRIDRLICKAAHENKYDRQWFVRRSRTKATRTQRAEIDDFVLDIVNTLIDNAGGRGDENILRERVQARVEDVVAGELSVETTAARSTKRKTAVVTKPNEPGYDADVAEMVRLFGGNEKSWRDVFNPDQKTNPPTTGNATRPRSPRREVR